MVTNPYLFYGVAGLVLAYLFYITLRKRKGERLGGAPHDLEL
ncbi:MAG: hypothetical protein NVSMB9_06180 [Isosphaeraceae bacterium]